MSRTTTINTIAILALVAVSAFANAHNDNDRDDRNESGAVFTSTNSPLGNQVLAFRRTHKGNLIPVANYNTGGLGTGAGLGSQNGVVITPDHNFLLAVNAASNDISIFAIKPWGLVLKSKTPSGGTTPISLTVKDDVVYVLNGGNGNNITGFYLGENGKLKAIPGSTNALSGAQVGPAEVQFSPDGDLLVVTEKATSQIDTFKVADDGTAFGIKTFPSAGKTPFGFVFGSRDRIFVSEANGGAVNGSALSSYDTRGNGDLFNISVSEKTNQTAACWTAIDSSGKVVYTTNAGSSSVSGYKISRLGEVKLLDPSGISGQTPANSNPIDAMITGNDRFLYVLTGKTVGITGFARSWDGSLTALDTTLGLPVGTTGIAGW